METKYKKVLAVSAALFLALCSAAFARDYRTGIFITDLYDLDQVDSTFSADFWIWCVYDGDETDFNGTLDIMHESSCDLRIYSSDKVRMPGEEELFWMQQKILAKFQCEWNMRNFPFDVNTLKIEIEDNRIRDEVNFLPDGMNSGVSEIIDIDGWKISGFTLTETPMSYNTNFGNPEIDEGGSGIYSRLCAEVTIRRVNPWITFFKLTACVYISILISVLAFFMKPNTDSRISLPCAALFAVMSNKYVVEAAVPSTTALTLLDSIHTTSLAVILAILFVIIKTDGMRATGNEKSLRQSLKIDRLAALAIAVAYMLLNAMLLVLR